MRQLLAVVCVLSLCLTLQAQWDLHEDFNDYDEGSIDQLGIVNDYGFDIEMWSAQANTPYRYDSGWSNVVTEDGYRCLQLINRDRGGELDTVYTSMYLGSDNIIFGEGTIYICYKATTENDCIMATNSLFPGYITNIYGQPISDDDGYQGTITYSSQSQLVRLGGGDQPFRARDGDVYRDNGLHIAASDVWYQLWIQFDCTLQQSRYYMCEYGDTPALVANPVGGQWWAWRNPECHTIDNIKFLTGLDDHENIVYISDIAVDSDSWTLDAPQRSSSSPYWWPFPWKCPWPWTLLVADFNGDGQVNLDDFIILKQNYGNGSADLSMGDANQDGTVNLDDFILLKQDYGLSADDL